MIIPKESNAQMLTWELKDAAWHEVEHLPLEEAVSERMRRSAQTVVELGFERRVRDPRRIVARIDNDKQS